MQRCIELANELVDELKKEGVDPIHIEAAESLRDDIVTDYEDMSEDDVVQGEETPYESKPGKEVNDNPDEEMDDELEKFAGDEVKKKTGKPALVIKIK